MLIISKLIILKNYNTRAEAELAKNILTSNDIKAVTASDGSGLSHVTLFSGPTNLLVNEMDKEKALKLLNDTANV